MMSWRTVLLTLLVLATVALAKPGGQRPPPPANPYADPKDDPDNPLKYIASNTLTAVAFALYMTVALVHTFSTWRWGARFMLAMVIGAYTFAFGIGTRFALNAQPDSKGWYIVEYLFVVLSPCAFIAANYVLLGRLSSYLRAGKYLLIPPRRITQVFITSDIVTFLIQAAGGSVSVAANTEQAATTGSHLFLAGLALQLVSFFTFTCLYAYWLLNVRRHMPDTWNQDKGRKPWYKNWLVLAFALAVSCVGILIRSVYRTIELSQGFQGHLATTEAYFYGLDTYPLFVAITIYIPFWPGRYIPRDVTSDLAMEAVDKPRASHEGAEPVDKLAGSEEAVAS